MTWTTPAEAETRELSQAPRIPQTSRARRTLAGAALGAVVLGTAAGLLAAVRDESVGASALVVTAPDPAAVDSGPTGGDPATRNATFIETELVFLGSTDFADRVAASVGLADADLQVERVGESNVITVISSADDRETALRTAQTAADLYVADRQQRLADRIADQTAAVESQIAATEVALQELRPPVDEAFDPQEQRRNALSERYADQLAIRDSLQRASADASQVAGLVQSATVPPPGLVSGPVLLVVLGVAAGALLGAVAPMVLASLAGRIRDEGDLRDVDAPVLSPPLPGRRIAQRRPDLLEQAVQLHGLRMADGPVSRGSLAVLAPTTGVGASFTAVQHAQHAARRGPTLLVCAGDDRNDTLAELDVDPRQLATVDLVNAGATMLVETLTDVAQPTSVPDLFVVSPVPRYQGHGSGVEHTVVSLLVRATAEAGWGLVVDTPPLDRSDLGVRAAGACAETLLVAGIGHSTVDDVERSLAALRVAGVPVTGVVLAHPRRRGWFRRRGARSVDAGNQAAHRKQVQHA